MRKTMLLILMVFLIVAFAGCQQGLSEEQVRSIVKEEVTNQLSTAQFKGIIGQEISKQIAGISELTISALNLKNEDGKIVATLQNFGVNGGQLTFFDSDGNQVAQLNDSGLFFDKVAIFGTFKNEVGNISGFIHLLNADGEPIFNTP